MKPVWIKNLQVYVVISSLELVDYFLDYFSDNTRLTDHVDGEVWRRCCAMEQVVENWSRRVDLLRSR